MAAIALYNAFNTSSVISAIGDAVAIGFAGMTGPFPLVIWWRKLTNADGEPIDLNDRFGTLPLFRRVEQ